MGKLVIIGYSGHAYVVIDAALKSKLKVFAYTEKVERILNPFKIRYLGFEEDESFNEWDKGYQFILGIGDNEIREKIIRFVISRNGILKSVIHPSATIGSHVNIEEGTFVGAGVSINPIVNIGKGVIINTGAIVEHGCQIDDFTHIAPSAVLAGDVQVGTRTFIGANAVIKEGIKIGNNVIIGAGAVVLENVRNDSKVVGNPGRYL